MDLQDFKKIITKLDKKLELRDDNLMDINMKLPTLEHEYLDIWGKESRLLAKLKAERKRLYGILYAKIKHDGDVAWDTKAEIDSQIHCDDKYHKMSIEVHQKEIMVEQLMKCVDNIKNIHWKIKNIIEYNKLFGHQ